MCVKFKGTQNMDRLAKLLSNAHTSFYAWVLIAKHAHLFFRTDNVTPATLIRRLLAGYAVEKGKAIAGENNYQLIGLFP